MRTASGLTSFALAFAMAGSAFAATVTPTGGTVQVNTGSGYANIAGPTTVGPGHMVMVKPGGSATIAYPNGCVFTVLPNTVIAVQKDPTCAGATASSSGTANFGGLVPHDYLLLGAVAIGAGVCIALCDSSKSP